MTKHVHMGPHNGPSSTGRSEHSNASLSWFVFAALVFYAATSGFAGTNAAFSSIAQFATKMSHRWDESVEPHVFTPLREQGWSVLHRATPAGSSGAAIGLSNPAQDQVARKKP